MSANHSSSPPHHVLFLIDQLHSTGGGAEGAIQKLCRFLPPDRFRCSVATFKALRDIQKHFPCPVHVFPLQRIYGWTALHQGLKLRRLLRSERVEIVHTFFAGSDIWGAIVATLSGCPVLISSRRDMGILRKEKHRIPYFFANRLVDQIQAVSDRVRNSCIAQDKLPPDKVITIRNGVDISLIDSALSSDRYATLGVGPNTPVVMTVANLRSVKGIDILLRAIAIVKTHVNEAMFAFVGEAHDDHYWAELMSLTGRLGIADNVKFLGPRTDVFSLLKMSDVFCLPSRTEGLSNALLEAMACGLPCVATDVGGSSEVVEDGHSGHLVTSENPDALASRLVTLLRDPELRRRMGNNGRKRVEQEFTVQHMVEQLVSSYEQLLGKRGATIHITTETVPSSVRTVAR